MIDGISTIIDVNLVRGPDYKPHKHRSESSSDTKLNSQPILVPPLKKSKVAICTKALWASPRHPAIRIKQWIDYHLLLGVGHFHIYDRKGNLEKGLKSYIAKGVLTLHPWPMFDTKWDWAYDQQMSHDACMLRHRHAHEWLFFIDTDEFLHFNLEDRDINSYLAQVEAVDPGIAQVMFQSVFFGGPSNMDAAYLFEEFTHRSNLTAGWREKPVIHASSVRFMWTHFASRLLCGKTIMANPAAARLNHYMIADSRALREPTGLFWWNDTKQMTKIEAGLMETMEATEKDTSMLWSLKHLPANKLDPLGYIDN